MDKAAYWKYLKNSLEIEDFLLPSTDGKSQALYKEAVDIGFFLSGHEVREEEARLFERMIGAMGLSRDQVALYLGQSPMDTSLAARIRVIFEEDTQTEKMGQWQAVGALQLFKTYSPRVLLAQPAYKKQSWEHLKSIFSVFSRQHTPG